MSRDIHILREVVVKVTQMIAGVGITVTQRGMQAYVKTDKRTGKPTLVNIPNIPDDASDELLMAIQGFIDHECGHILDTLFAAQMAVSKKGPEVYNLWNIIEDVYIERRMRERFPGAAYNLERMHHFFLNHITLPLMKAKGGSEMADLAVLLVPACRAWGGQKAFVDFMNGGWWSRIAWILPEIPESLKDRMAKIKDSWESKVIAEEIDAILRKARAKKLAPPPPPAPAACAKPKKKLEPKPKKEEDDGEGEGEGAGTAPEEKKEESGKGKPSAEPKEPAEEEGAEEEASAAPGGDEEKDDGETEPAEGEPPAGSGDEEKENEEAPGAGEEEEPKGAGSDADEPGDGSDDAVSEPEDEGEPGSGAAAAEREKAEGDADDGSDGDVDEDAGEASGVGDADPAEGEEPEDTGDIPPPPPSHTPMDDQPSWLEEMNKEGHELKDFDNAIAEKITDEATAAIDNRDYLIYSRDFDQIVPFVSDVPRDPAEAAEYDGKVTKWLTTLDDHTRHMVGVMQKDIERMMAARSMVVNVPGYRRGRLHAASLHRLAVGDDRVFRRRTESRSKDVAVGLLIDNSGSMQGHKMRLAMTSGFALSQTLERVSIQHEVLGFTTLEMSAAKGLDPRMVQAEETRIGRGFDRFEPLYMPIYKGFDERLTSETRKRFATAINQQDFCTENVDGESVDIAAWRLAQRKEKRKVLIVLSDGFPACRSHSSKLHRHLKDTVKKATARGIEVFGIGILSDAVKEFYPNHVVLSDATELPTVVVGKLKEFLLK